MFQTHHQKLTPNKKKNVSNEEDMLDENKDENDCEYDDQNDNNHNPNDETLNSSADETPIKRNNLDNVISDTLSHNSDKSNRPSSSLSSSYRKNIISDTISHNSDESSVSNVTPNIRSSICSDLAQVKPLEDAIVQAVKQQIKSGITISKIPREKKLLFGNIKLINLFFMLRFKS